MTRVDAPTRLHFGLLALPVGGQERWPDGLPVRCFGGVGLMIDGPRIRVQAARSDTWSATGPNADRALGFARALSQTLPPAQQRPCIITVEEIPQQHTGLGVGTALALATAKAVAIEGWGLESGVKKLESHSGSELARSVGRGERSAVGLYGFDLGGLIVEAGKLPGENLAPLVGRYAFPPQWRIVLVNPSTGSAWHGSRERQAFARLTRNNATEALCRIVLTGLLPALASMDLPSFGEALHEYNRRAGEGFASEQGGAWSSPEVAEAIACVRSEGVRGTGQSSWGPTVFAIVADDDAARGLKERLGARLALPPATLTITHAAAHGAQTTTDRIENQFSHG